MSVTVVVAAAAGSVMVSSQLLSAIVGLAAAQLGMKMLEGAQNEAAEEERNQRMARSFTPLAEQELEVSIATEAALGQVVAERCELRLADERIEMKISRDIRGKLTIKAHGEGVSRAEVTARAERLLGLIRQQIAYREAVTRMKQHGFMVAEEQALKDGTVQLKLKVKKQ